MVFGYPPECCSAWPESPAGRTTHELLAGFRYLEEQDILEAVAFAARLAQGDEIRFAS
jgi:uncharacterized protein (DUF433 family)